jgi:hypothetical protein
MKEIFHTIGTWIHEALSEPGPNGGMSWGRCAATATVIASICWVTYLLVRTHAMPDLTGPMTFGLSPYVANKAITTVQSFGTNPVNK